jgi:hypothetical protein
MSVVFVGCEYEGQPTQTTSGMDTKSLSKKPEKPERITFTGDLSGQEDILGCCPNAGPFPEYTMTLSETFSDLSGTYDGNIFMNVYGAGKNKSYIVQFWDETMFLEVIGGDIEKDNQTKTTTVTFTDEQCGVTIANVTTTFEVNFTLTRAPAQ